MHRPKASRSLTLLIATLCGWISVGAQTVLKETTEIKLPLPSSLGQFGRRYPSPGTPAQDLTVLKIMPDQSALIFQPVADGKWFLIQINYWWTGHPVSRILQIPGWTGKDIWHGDVLGVDFQITPSGRYAVAFSAASWDGKASVRHKFDTVVTLIDLEQWKIFRSFHTAEKDPYISFRGARILNDRWIAMEGMNEESSPKPYAHLYERSHRLISIPDLGTGPGCISRRPDLSLPPETPAPKWKSALEAIDNRNDETCQKLLTIAGVASVKSLESQIYRGHSLEPDALLRQKMEIFGAEELHKPRLLMDESEREFHEYDRWEKPHYGTYAIEPPLQSPSLHWYATHGFFGKGPISYDLEIFDSHGNKLKEEASDHLLCEANAYRGRKGACVCRIDDVAEEQDTLLTYCRTFSHDFLDVEIQHKQWLSVFHSRDLTDVGLIPLPNHKEILEAIAIANGRAYALVLESSRVLRVFPVSDNYKQP